MAAGQTFAPIPLASEKPSSSDVPFVEHLMALARRYGPIFELPGPGARHVTVLSFASTVAPLDDYVNRLPTHVALLSAIPLGRIGSPEEAADLVVWLASDQARYLTATTVFIDGGIMQASAGL